jgi:hypothetical protein
LLLFWPLKFLCLLFLHPRNRPSGSRLPGLPEGIFGHIDGFGSALRKFEDRVIQQLSLTYHEASVDKLEPEARDRRTDEVVEWGIAGLRGCSTGRAAFNIDLVASRTKQRLYAKQLQGALYMV